MTQSSLTTTSQIYEGNRAFQEQTESQVLRGFQETQGRQDQWGPSETLVDLAYREYRERRVWRVVALVHLAVKV